MTHAVSVSVLVSPCVNDGACSQPSVPNCFLLESQRADTAVPNFPLAALLSSAHHGCRSHKRTNPVRHVNDYNALRSACLTCRTTTLRQNSSAVWCQHSAIRSDTERQIVPPP